MAEIDGYVQARAFADKWFVVIVVVLLFVSAVLGWWAFQVNMVPDTREEERLVESWSESSSYTHSALIVNDSLPFAEGSVVRNRPIYYFNLSKDLDGTYGYTYEADDGDLAVTTDTFLLIRGGELENQEINQSFWQVARPLETARSDSLAPGEQHTVAFTVDIRYVLETITTVQRQLGSTEGLVDVRVRSISTVEGEVEGEAVSRTYESDLVMVVNPAIFRVIEADVVSERHQSFATAEIIVQPSPTEAYGSIGLFVLSLVLLASLGVARVNGSFELSEEERELLAIVRQREQHSDWITTGTFPAERNYDQTILVDDLRGLIDVAIDTNKRVIEDTQLGVSTVLDNDYIYMYVRPDSPARNWLVNYADTTLDEFESYEF